MRLIKISNKWTFKKVIYIARRALKYISYSTVILIVSTLVTTSLSISMLPVCFRVTMTHFRLIRSSKEIAGSGLTQGENLPRRIFRFGWRIHLIRRRGIDAFRYFWLTNFEALLLLFYLLLLLRGHSWRWIIVGPSGVTKVSKVASSNLSLALIGDSRPEKSRKMATQRFLSFLYFRPSRHVAKTLHNYLTL